MSKSLAYIRALAASALIAASVWTLPAFGAGASLDDATEEQKAKAKDKYLAGKAAYDQKKYEEALLLFEDSYGTVASPNSHLMVARCLARLGRAKEAFDAFRETEAEAVAASQSSDKYEVTATAARNESAEVRAQLAMITVEVAGKATVGDADVGPLRSAKPTIVAPGPVTVRLETAGGQVEEQIDAVAGEETLVTLAPAVPATGPAVAAPAPAPPAAEPTGIDQKVLAYVIGGVGVAGLATFGVFGFLNNQKFDDLESQCDANGICPEGLAEDGETGRTYQTIANVGLGVGIVGLGAGLTLFLTAPSSSEQASTAPRIAVGPGSVRVDGRF